jgi:hypothetical protein
VVAVQYDCDNDDFDYVGYSCLISDVVSIDSLTRLSYHVQTKSCTIGLVAFKLLGGKFWAISPSSYTHLGAFARGSLPATERYATASQRAEVGKLGRIFGCHTCGARSRSFVGDHMPPKVVAEQLAKRSWLLGGKRHVQFRFYPQCVKCSGMQGGILSKATLELRNNRRASHQLHKIRSNAYFHGWKFRPIHHLAGGVVAVVAVGGVSDEDLDDENRSRYATIHRHLIGSLQTAQKEAAKFLPYLDDENTSRYATIHRHLNGNLQTARKEVANFYDENRSRYATLHRHLNGNLQTAQKEAAKFYDGNRSRYATIHRHLNGNLQTAQKEAAKFYDGNRSRYATIHRHLNGNLQTAQKESAKFLSSLAR